MHIKYLVIILFLNFSNHITSTESSQTKSKVTRRLIKAPRLQSSIASAMWQESENFRDRGTDQISEELKKVVIDYCKISTGNVILVADACLWHFFNGFGVKILKILFQEDLLSIEDLLKSCFLLDHIMHITDVEECIIDFLQLFIINGLDINLINSSGLLLEAESKHYLKVVEFLLSVEKIDPYIKNRKGRNIFDIYRHDNYSKNRMRIMLKSKFPSEFPEEGSCIIL